MSLFDEKRIWETEIDKMKLNRQKLQEVNKW